MKYPASRQILSVGVLSLSAALLAIFAFSSEPATPTRAATSWVVTSTADGAPNISNCPDPTQCRLRDAIAKASPGDTITFSVTLPATITLTTGSSLSVSDLTISGPGATSLAVSGNNTVTVFSTSGKVTIRGVTIRDGNHAGNQGGGIDNSGTLTLSNAIVISNTAQFGGGIYNAGGTLILIGSSVANNLATGEGGGIYNNSTGGPALVTVLNSMISGNIAQSGVGGGILSGGPVTITNSSVLSNTATDNGGGIWITGAMLRMSQSYVIGNISSQRGGGLFNTGQSTATLDTVIVRGNLATGQVGGGIYNDSSMTMTNSAVSGNIISGTIVSGGGIYSNNNLTITNSTIDNNSALGTSDSNGGGIYQEGSTALVTLNNVTISGNNANGGSSVAGGIHIAAGTATLNNVSITRNRGGNSGGGVAMYGIAFNFQNTILAGNSATSGPDCATGVTLNSQGYNLIGDSAGCTIGGTLGSNQSGDPKLAPLAYLGGPTQTHGLLSGSPALNHGNNATCLATDQRGILRPLTLGNPCDIGAFEGTAFALYLPLILR